MRWIAALVLRFFFGTMLGMGLFLVNAFWLLDDSANSVAGTVLAVLVPMLFGWIIGFVLVEVWNAQRWSRFWLPLASGELDHDEYRREQLVKAGIRCILGPWTLPLLSKARLRTYLEEWTRSLIRYQCSDEWTWELYALSLPLIEDSPETLEQLEQMLLAEDRPPETAILFGIELASILSPTEDAVLMLAREGFKLGSEIFTPQQRTLFESLCAKAYRLDASLKPVLLPYLVNRFVETRRADEFAGIVYLDAVESGEAIHGIRREMTRIGRVLQRNNRETELASALLELGEKLPAQEFEDELPVEEEVWRPGDRNAASQPQAPRIEQYTAKGTIADSFDSVAAEEEPEFPEESEQVIDEFQEAEKLSPAWEDAPGSDESEPISTELEDESEYYRLPSWKENLAGYGEKLKNVPQRIWLITGSSLGALIVLIVIISMITGGPAVDDDAVTSSLTPPGPYISDQPYTIQVAAHRNRGPAEAQTFDLRGKGVDAYLVEPVAEGSKFFRVRTGRFTTSDSARSIADSMKAAGLIEDYFVAPFEPGLVPSGQAAKGTEPDGQ